MSELSLLVARGSRWFEGCKRLARECRLFRISPCSNVGESSTKLLCLRTISRQLTWWNSVRGLSLSRRKHFSQSFLPTIEICISWRDASIVPERDTSGITGDERHGSVQDTAQTSLYLQEVLDIDAETADHWVQNYPGFTVVDKDEILRNYKACRDAGFSETAIRRIPHILLYPHKFLNNKIKLITNINLDVIDDAIPLFELNITALRSLCGNVNYEIVNNGGVNRITYLAEQLQCPTLVVCQILVKHRFMRTTTFSKISRVLRLMLDAHVAKEDILNDIWAFRYNPEVISQRLKRATDAGVYPVKPWMIRCPEDLLTRRIGKAMRQQSVLGNNGTIVEYLSRRFKCDNQTINALISKCPKVSQISGPKIERVVDFLLANGYTIEHVMRVPRVLLHKLETMQGRLIELQKYGYKPKRLTPFCKSRRQYDDYLSVIKVRYCKFDNE